MPYLAVDTATQTLTIAIGERNQLWAETSVVVKKNHSHLLMPMIESLLESTELIPGQLKGIVVGQGPGSYTGVRIGVTTGKMMAWALQIPLVGVSSLDGLALQYRESDNLVCPLFDARRKQAYCALYERSDKKEDQGTEFRKIEPDALRKLEDFFPLISKRLTQQEMAGRPAKVVFLGNGAENHKEWIRQKFGEHAEFAESGSRQLVRAANLLDEGIVRIEAGDVDEVKPFTPEYLQLVEAEAKLLNKKLVKCERNGGI